MIRAIFRIAHTRKKSFDFQLLLNEFGGILKDVYFLLYKIYPVNNTESFRNYCQEREYLARFYTICCTKSLKIFFTKPILNQNLKKKYT